MIAEKQIFQDEHDNTVLLRAINEASWAHDH